MRHSDWDLRLNSMKEKVLGEPFEWGRTDCATLVVRALEAMYPPDDVPLPAERPSYGDESGALRAHAATGGVSDVLRAQGAEEVPLNFARQGDVLIGVDEAGGVPGAAIVVENRYLVASEEEGVVLRRLRDLREAGGEGVTVLRVPHDV